MYKWKNCDNHDVPIKFRYVSEMEPCPFCMSKDWEDKYYTLRDSYDELEIVLVDTEENLEIKIKELEREISEHNQMVIK